MTEVVGFLTRMDDAARIDFERAREKQPAVNKVAMMAEVELTFKKEFMHDTLLDRGALHSCTKWLQPLSDGTLPNEAVRAAILRSLANFDCDSEFKVQRSTLDRWAELSAWPRDTDTVTARHSAAVRDQAATRTRQPACWHLHTGICTLASARQTISLPPPLTVAAVPLVHLPCCLQERLRSSGVGKYVMLLSKHSDESPENKRRCLALIEKWMRPVYKKTLDHSHGLQLARPRRIFRRRRKKKHAVFANLYARHSLDQRPAPPPPAAPSSARGCRARARPLRRRRRRSRWGRSRCRGRPRSAAA